MMAGTLLKCKVEPDDEIKTLDDVGNAIFEATVKKDGKFENVCLTENEELLHFNKLLEESENLTIANTAIKEKLHHQEKLIAFYEDRFCCHETNILSTNMSIDRLKKKVEAGEREISTWKFQLHMLQNELLQFKKLLPEEYPDKKAKETKRKNDEDLDIHAAFGDENDTQPLALITEPIQLDCSVLKNPSATKSQKVCEPIKLKGTALVDLNSSLNNSVITFSNSCDTLSENRFMPESNNETQPSNDLLSMHSHQNLETLNSRKSVNTSDAEKALNGNALVDNAFLSPDIERCIYGRPMKDNSSLVQPLMEKIKVVIPAYGALHKPVIKNNVEKLECKSSIAPIPALNKSVLENNVVESVYDCSMEVNSSLNKPDIVIIDSKDATKGSFDTDKAFLNNLKFSYNDVNKNVEGISLEAPISVSKLDTEPCNTMKTSEQFDILIKELDVSSLKKTNINFNMNSEENGHKNNYSNNKFSFLSKSNVLEKEKSNNSCLSNFENVCYKEHINPICQESCQVINDSSASKFISFITGHCQKLRMELDRIRYSEFTKYREGTNSLLYKLENIDTTEINEESFIQNVELLIDYFINPKTFDMATLIYLIVDFLSRDRIPHEKLPTYIENQNTYVFLTASESCIVSALYEVEKKSLPHLNGLLKNTLNIVHQVVISKKKMTLSGLSSLCRVFMEINRRCNNRWEPLFLCCELLRLGHSLAPYLINSLAAVWRDPFNFYDKFSDEENMVLGSIMYGMKEKPFLMKPRLWKLTNKLRSTYFPRPFILDPQQAVQFLTARITTRCVEGLFENLWMLASPLVIFVSKETREWKIQFRNGYILPNLQHFSRSLNEQAFGLFCNLFVDIFSFCPVSPYEELLQYFTNTEITEGATFVQDCAAVALLKYIGNTDKQVPAPLRDWFLRNQDNPKLALIVDLYCKKVMESHGSFLLWDDIIL